MKIRTVFAGLALATGLLAGSLALAFDRAGRNLEKSGYTNVDVHFLPIQLGKEPFKNNFTATAPDGRKVEGEIAMNRRNTKFDIRLK